MRQASEPASARLARRALASFIRTQSALGRTPLPKNDRDVEIDRDTFTFLRAMARAGKAFDPNASVGAMRRDYDTVGTLLDVPFRALGHVEDRELELSGHSIRARFYLPRERRQNGPGLVWLHGGGFVIGSLASHDHAMREMAYQIDAPVIAVDYRLGPDHRYPSSHDDALDAFCAIWRDAVSFGIDRDRIALGGDSAGANLALSTALSLKAAREPLPAYLALVYPPTELEHRSASREHNGSGYFLTSELMTWFSDRFVQSEANLGEPRMSVLRAASFAGMPRTLVTTAGFDPLRDEGETLARRMREDGVDVEHRSEDRLIHGYLTMGGIVPEARRALHAVAVAIKSALG